MKAPPPSSLWSRETKSETHPSASGCGKKQLSKIGRSLKKRIKASWAATFQDIWLLRWLSKWSKFKFQLPKGGRESHFSSSPYHNGNKSRLWTDVATVGHIKIVSSFWTFLGGIAPEWLMVIKYWGETFKFTELSSSSPPLFASIFQAAPSYDFPQQFMAAINCSNVQMMMLCLPFYQERYTAARFAVALRKSGSKSKKMPICLPVFLSTQSPKRAS